MSEKYFILFANCIPVKGANRSLICDLQNGRGKVIPNLLFDAIGLFGKMTVAGIKQQYNGEINEGLDLYLKALEDEGYGFWTTEPQSFPKLELRWESPSVITNSILDLDEFSSYNVSNVVCELEELGCISVQLRLYSPISFDKLIDLLSSFEQTRIKSVEIIMKDSGWDDKKIELICNSQRRIRLIHFYSSNETKTEIKNNYDLMITYTTVELIPDIHCGIVGRELFTINMDHFMESQKYNTCLNRKLSVDRLGQIKNCPSSKEVYGIVGRDLLKDVISNSSLSSYWGINKDQIMTCRDCEFRYICTDCRVFLQDKEDLLSKPAKCKYDPYTSTWAI